MLDRSPRRDRQRQRATVRTRRYRERLRNGCIVAPVPVPPKVVGLLLDLHWLGASLCRE